MGQEHGSLRKIGEVDAAFTIGSRGLLCFWFAHLILRHPNLARVNNASSRRPLCYRKAVLSPCSDRTRTIGAIAVAFGRLGTR
jgi:hypothetical protein